MNVDLMPTRTFITMMDEDYQIKEAATGWQTRVRILAEELDYGEEDGPAYDRPII
jgi:hypothetical protein